MDKVVNNDKNNSRHFLLDFEEISILQYVQSFTGTNYSYYNQESIFQQPFYYISTGKVTWHYPGCSAPA